MKKNKEIKARKHAELRENSELLKAIINFNKKELFALSVSFILISILKWIFKFPLSIGILVTLFVSFLVILVYLYLLNNLLKRKEDVFTGLENICLGYFISNIIIYTLMVYYISGTELIGIFIYFFLIAEANFILSPKRAFSVTLIATLCYILLAFFRYSGLIAYDQFFIPSPNLYSNYSYLLFTIFTIAVIGFHYVGFLIRIFAKSYMNMSGALKEERTEFTKAQGKLEEAKDTLEIKVKARTRELEELTQNLEKQVVQRTNELQEKLKELERFQKFAIGREIKMVDLKEEIKKLQKKKK